LDVAALAAILVGKNDVFHGNWQAPAFLILFSGFFAMAAIWNRRWSYGPKVRDFYNSTTADVSKASVSKANADLISDLIDNKTGALAISERALRWKSFWFKGAIVLIVAAGFWSAILLR
jgi:hypothetical protein